MLETGDSAKGIPAAPDEGPVGPPAHAEADAGAATGWREGDAAADPGPRNGSSAGAGGGDAASTCWSDDWLQLSHELRTPLNAILGNIELLLDGSAGPFAAPVRACIGDIQAASRALLGQLQPLLLLVQARTSGPVTSALPIDLLALVRQAVRSAPGSGARALTGGLPGQSTAWRGEQRGPAGESLTSAASSPADTSTPDDACLMVRGDPVWLGALAATLVELHAASARDGAPLSIDLEPLNPGPGGAIVRASWPELDPGATSPLPLALIDAVLALHGGRVRSLSADGLRLELPGASIVQSSMSDRGRL